MKTLKFQAGSLGRTRLLLYAVFERVVESGLPDMSLMVFHMERREPGCSPRRVAQCL